MKYISLITLLLIATPAFAQEETLFGDKDVEHGGFGGPMVSFTNMNSQFAVLVGGRGGWIINHFLCLGGGGYGLANDVPAKVVGPYGQRFLNLGYGGFDLEVIFESDRVFHFSTHALVGGGAVGFRYGSWEDTNQYQLVWGDIGTHSEMDQFFILEPGINLDVNITPWFRTSVTASYRYISGVSSTTAATNGSLSGASAGLLFRFGKF